MADVTKLAQEIEQLTALELSELASILKERFGVSAIAPMAAMAMPSAAPAAAVEEEVEEQTEFDVILQEYGAKKIQVIKAVRQLTTLGLKEAKDVVDNAPSTILEQVSKEAAEDAKAKLEAEGAIAEIR